jgi:hypothetical protein
MNALASPARSGPAVINVTVNAKDAVLTHTVQQWVRDGVAAAAQLGTVAGAAEGERRVMSRGRRRIPG